MQFADRILAVHDALARHGIEHGFGGAIALAYAVHEPRATVDIDVNVAGDPDDPRRVLAALPAGVIHTRRDVTTIRREGQVRLWWDDTPVDLFFPQHAFHAVVAARYVEVPFADRTIPVLSPTDLMVFKALWKGTKDWADIEAMLDAGTADVVEALLWIEQIAGRKGPSYEHLARLAEALT